MGPDILVCGISNLEFLSDFLQLKGHYFGFVVHIQIEVWNELNDVVDGILNASVGSIGVLIETWVVLLPDTVEGLVIVLVGYRAEGYETVDLMYEGGDLLGKSVMPAVGSEAGAT